MVRGRVQKEMSWTERRWYARHGITEVKILEVVSALNLTYITYSEISEK